MGEFEEVRRWISGVANGSRCFWDARYWEGTSTRVVVEDGVVKSVGFHESRGVGIRVLESGGWGFASTSRLERGDVEGAFNLAKKLAGRVQGNCPDLPERDPVERRFQVPVLRDVADVEPEQKVAFLLERDGAAREFDSRVASTRFTYTDLRGTSGFVDSDSVCLLTSESFVLFTGKVVAKSGGALQAGSRVMGGPGGWEVLAEKGADRAGEECAREAVQLLGAAPPPSGKHVVVVDPSLCGTFVHEAVGHASEADLVLAGNSILKGKLGERVAAECVTVVDDATAAKSAGFYFHDSEGERGRRNVVVERGILRSYLHSRETAARAEIAPTANGRATSHLFPPLPRMSNTSLEPGDHSLEELIDVREGLLAEDWVYGYADPGSGMFSFKVKRARWIRRGELGGLVRDAAVSGNTREVLLSITGVGREVRRTDGTCVKNGQSVPVGDAGVHARVEKLLVGGRW